MPTSTAMTMPISMIWPSVNQRCSSAISGSGIEWSIVAFDWVVASCSAASSASLYGPLSMS